MNPFDLSSQQLQGAKFLSERRVGNVIGGVSGPALSGRWLPVTDPATEMVVAEAPDSDAADIAHAVACAQRAFGSDAWRGLRPTLDHTFPSGRPL